jgi:hypothetical protein
MGLVAIGIAIAVGVFAVLGMVADRRAGHAGAAEQPDHGQDWRIREDREVAARRRAKLRRSR